MVVPFTEMENSLEMVKLQGKDQRPFLDLGYWSVHETCRRRCSETELWLPHLSLSCIFTSSTGSSCQPSLSSPFHPFKNINIKTSYSLDRALCSSYCSHPLSWNSSLHLLFLLLTATNCDILTSIVPLKVLSQVLQSNNLIAKFKVYLFSFHRGYFCCVSY